MARMRHRAQDTPAESLYRWSNSPPAARSLGTSIKARVHTQTAMAAGMAFAI